MKIARNGRAHEVVSIEFIRISLGRISEKKRNYISSVLRHKMARLSGQFSAITFQAVVVAPY